MIKTKIQRLAETKKSNSESMLSLLIVSMDRICKQGTGCTDSMGAAYVNKADNTRDSIAIVATQISDKYLRMFYGLISEEHQRPIVKSLIYNFSININAPGEYERFVDFLQKLQDAHDIAFDQFNQVKLYTLAQKFNIFLENCAQIKKEFKL